MQVFDMHRISIPSSHWGEIDGCGKGITNHDPLAILLLRYPCRRINTSILCCFHAFRTSNPRNRPPCPLSLNKGCVKSYVWKGRSLTSWRKFCIANLAEKVLTRVAVIGSMPSKM